MKPVNTFYSAADSANAEPFTAAGIAKSLRLFFPNADDVFELRALKVRSGSLTADQCGYFTGASIEAAAAAAFKLSGRAYGCYFTLNPLAPACHARRPDRMGEAVKKVCSKDADVAERRWMLIDLDPVRAADTSATGPEKAAACELAATIADKLGTLHDFPPPAIADSGNGWHLFYRCCPDVDKGTIAALLKALAASFNTPAVHVDTTVFNPSRIVKVPGTMGCKGAPTAERPHRAGRMISVPEDDPLPLTAALLTAATARLNADADLLNHPVIDFDAAPGNGLPLPDRIRRYMAAVEPAVSGSGGHGKLFYAACCLVHGFDLPADDARPFLEEYAARCLPPWGEKDVGHKLAQAEKKAGPRGYLLGKETGTGRVGSSNGDGAGSQRGDGAATGSGLPVNRAIAHAAAGHGKAAAAKAASSSALYEKATDPYRIARTYAEHQAGIVCWREEFYLYGDGRYEAIPKYELSAQIVAVAKTIFDDDHAEKMSGWALGGSKGKPPHPETISTAIISATLKVLAGMCTVSHLLEPPFYVRGPLALQPLRDTGIFRNGVMRFADLLSDNDVQPTPLGPDLFNLYRLNYDITPDAPNPVNWLSFLATSWPDDSQAIECLQEMMGYLLTTDTTQQKIFMIVGQKRSGKGTIIRTIEAMIGKDNCVSANMGQLAGSFGLADWIGKSLAIFPDVRKSEWSESTSIVERLLSISGEDRIAIERKYLSTVSAQIGARILMASNVVPKFPDSSLALANRFIVLDMAISHLGHEDTTLGPKLIEELPGIIWWAVEGWRRLRERGRFVQPDSGREHVEDLEDLSNPVVPFANECLVLEEGASTPIADLYAVWAAWAKKNGHKEIPSNIFARNLKSRFPTVKTTQPRLQQESACQDQDIVRASNRQRCLAGVRIREDV